MRNAAEPGLPCLARSTYDLVRERFAYQSAMPRAVPVAGFGDVEVWEVARGSR